MKKFGDYWTQFIGFLKEDSWTSLFVTLLIAFVVIKFLFFPGLEFLTGTSLPLVIVESCSMHHHEDGFERSFESSSVYDDYGISIKDTGNWDFQNGFNKGDIIFVVGADNIKVGDVIIFNGGAQHPLIHRVVYANESYSTKGDNDITNRQQLSMEKNISKDQLIGKAVFKIPFAGWVKLIFFEGGRPNREKGFCR